MPAGFNKGQIEYIKTIANVNGHKTYKPTAFAQQHISNTGSYLPPVDTHCRYAIFCLGDKPLVNPVGNVLASTDLIQNAKVTSLDVYNVPIQADQSAADENERVTPECFLESVNLKMRHIIPLDETIDEQSHKEFRLMVFRHREKQHASAQLSQNRSDPLYDLWHGAGNYKYGPEGYRKKMDDEGTINYQAWGSYSANYDRQRMLTDPMNTEDYVVMKDCRYYLGREYGGKHIYEDRFFWNHEDPISTDMPDLTYNDSDKNYCWYIMILCSNNSSTAVSDIGHINFQANTYVTSG